MKKVAVGQVENRPHRFGVNSVRRYVSDDLGTEHLAIVYYELEPGEQFSGGLHTHYDQEEVFYILEGTATFEYSRDRVEVAVEAGEVIRFRPGEFQCGHNRTDRRVVALALAAPVPSGAPEKIEWFGECDVCGEETMHSNRPHEPDEQRVSYCLECGNEIVA